MKKYYKELNFGAKKPGQLPISRIMTIIEGHVMMSSQRHKVEIVFEEGGN